MAVVFQRRRSVVVEEGLLGSLRSESLCITTTFASGRVVSERLGLDIIDAVVLNEGITRQRVVVYMAIFVRGQARFLL